MPPANQPPQPPPAFSIQVANGLYLDSQNHFHSGALPDAPVYKMGGGILSLHSEIKDGVLSGQLAILPLKDVPGWATKLKDLGVADETIELFGKAANLASSIVSVVGWAQAAFKIAEMLGLFKQGKSVEQLVQEVLAKLGVVQEMVAQAHWQNVKLFVDTSVAEIEGKRDHVLTALGNLENYDVQGRRAIRKEMLDAAEDADIEVRKLLSTSRWELFNQNKQYLGLWYGATSEEVTNENPPYWGASTAWAGPRKQLANDGTTWADAVYPKAYEPRFDYRAALPATLAGVMSYLTMLTMAEPEFRSTGSANEALIDMAKALDGPNGLIEKMRAVLVRTHYEAYHFVYAGHEDEIIANDPDGSVGPQLSTVHFKLPHFY